MRFEEAYLGWSEGRLTQANFAPKWLIRREARFSERCLKIGLPTSASHVTLRAKE